MKLSESAISYANENCNGKIMPKTWQIIHDSYIDGASSSSQRIKELIEAIETTITGLEWKLENEPSNSDKADSEHLDLLKQLIQKNK